MLCVTVSVIFCDSTMQHDIQKQPVTARNDEKLQQTMTLTARRLDIHQQVCYVAVQYIHRPCYTSVGVLCSGYLQYIHRLEHCA